MRTAWLAARRAVARLDPALDLGADVSLGIRVLGPGGLTPTSVKPLLDGVISALHVVSASDVLTVPTLVRWGLAEAERLVTRGPAPLGARQLIVHQGPNRPAWNPADDRFDEILLGAPTGGGDRTEVEVYRLPAP